MSVFFDCLWWWRAEFGDRSNPYLDSEPDQLPARESASAVAAVAPTDFDAVPDASFIPGMMLPMSGANIPDLPDWDWAGLEEIGWS